MVAQAFNTDFTGNTHAEGAYITFRAGDTHFALAVSYVRYITTSQSLNRRSSPTKEGKTLIVFDFGGESLALYNFNEMIKTGAHTEEIEALITLLNDRQEDHVSWLAELETSLKTGQPFTKAGDHHQCAFGKWYDSYQAQDAELKRILAAFRDPHRRLHALAEELTGQVKRGITLESVLRQLQQARESTFGELLTLFDDAQRRLEELNKPVVIVLEDGRHKFGLQVESIGDIKQFETSAWLPDQNAGDNCCYDGYFQTGDALYLNIMPQSLLQMA